MVEDVLYKALLETATLSEALTKYDNRPAVFFADAANGADAKWSKEQYPRCVYVIDWSNDPERKRSGLLAVDVFCVKEAPEDIGERLMAEISGAFMTDHGQTYSIVWKKTDQFEVSGSEPRVSGVTVYFDIVAFPVQETTTPDPVLSAMAWVKERQPNMHVIGIDDADEFWKPTDDRPVCYVRMSGETATVRPTWACTWLRANVVVHVICPDVAERMAWVKCLSNDLALEAEITTDDGSPMFVKSVTVDSGANPITAGQLTFVGEYGVLRKVAQVDKLQHVYVGGVKVGAKD